MGQIEQRTYQGIGEPLIAQEKELIGQIRQIATPAVDVYVAPEKRKPCPIRLHVENETDALKTVALWGSPGPEAVLAQFLSPQENLFFEQFDVIGARKEYAFLIQRLRDHDVKIVMVQDLMLKNIDPEKLDDKDEIPGSIKELVDALQKRGHDLYKKHHEKHGVGNLDTLDLMPVLIEDDIERLGEEKAILLNWMLSLRHIQPSGNIFYGRDQSNVLGRKLVWSSMRWPIRRSEICYYEMGLKPVLPEKGHFRVKGRETFLEGGDGIMLGRDCYLGVGGRTTMAAAVQVYNELKSHLRDNDARMIVVVDAEAEHRAHIQKHPGEEMAAMHLDTFWMPFGSKGKKVLCCMEEVAKRQVYFLEEDEEHHIKYNSGGSFLDFMIRENFQICPIPRREQLRYATNFLNLDGDTAIVPFSDNNVAINHLHNNGIKTHPIEMTELGGGYGAIHCMTTALERY